MAYMRPKIEVDLTIKLWGTRDTNTHDPLDRVEEPKLEVLEEKKFNKLTVKEALRNLIDYLIESF